MAIIASRIVEVCVFRFINNRPEYLMLKRSAAARIYPNLWQFVSGSLEDGEKATVGALREMKEETGLHPQRFWVVPHTTTFYDPLNDAVNISPLFAAQVAVGDEPRLSSEHSAYQWLLLADARGRLVWPGQRLGLGIVDKYILGGEEAGLLTEIPV